MSRPPTQWRPARTSLSWAVTTATTHTCRTCTTRWSGSWPALAAIRWRRLFPTRGTARARQRPHRFGSRTPSWSGPPPRASGCTSRPSTCPAYGRRRMTRSRPGVGGTSLGIGRSGHRLFETGWSTGTTDILKHGWARPDQTLGAGGGPSPRWAEPGYQKGIVPAALSRHRASRSTPDLGALADPVTGIKYGVLGSRSTPRRASSCPTPAAPAWPRRWWPGWSPTRSRDTPRSGSLTQRSTG